MAQFTIARFTDGDVIASGWWAPADGETVYLTTVPDGALLVSKPTSWGYGEGVRYTWPRHKSHEDAARLAWRHYERQTHTA